MTARAVSSVRTTALFVSPLDLGSGGSVMLCAHRSTLRRAAWVAACMGLALAVAAGCNRSKAPEARENAPAAVGNSVKGENKEIDYVDVSDSVAQMPPGAQTA